MIPFSDYNCNFVKEERYDLDRVENILSNFLRKKDKHTSPVLSVQDVQHIGLDHTNIITFSDVFVDYKSARDRVLVSLLGGKFGYTFYFDCSAQILPKDYIFDKITRESPITCSVLWAIDENNKRKNWSARRIHEIYVKERVKNLFEDKGAKVFHPRFLLNAPIICGTRASYYRDKEKGLVITNLIHEGAPVLDKDVHVPLSVLEMTPENVLRHKLTQQPELFTNLYEEMSDEDIISMYRGFLYEVSSYFDERCHHVTFT